MLSHVGHNTHGNHPHSQQHNHPNQHHSHLTSSSYHLNTNNSNIIPSSAEGGMFNEREVHSMLESAVKGGNMLNMNSSCAGGNVSPSDMSGSSSHTSPQPAACPMDEHMASTGGGDDMMWPGSSISNIKRKAIDSVSVFR